MSCASTNRYEQIRQIGVQTFGTDTYLKTHEVIYAGPISSTLVSISGSTSDQLALASDMRMAEKQRVDLVVWGNSSSRTATTIEQASRRYCPQPLPQLNLLFLGKSEDAERVKQTVESTGAKFSFQQR